MSEWVSIKERLPEKYGQVDVWLKATEVPEFKGTRHPDAWFMLGGFWSSPDDGPSFESMGYEVTHWMVVEQPKENSDE